MDKLTQDEKRIRIAIHLGWQDIYLRTLGDSSKLVGYPPDEDGRKEATESQCFPDIPDYFADLNACHEAEKKLVLNDIEKRNAYADLISVELPPTKFFLLSAGPETRMDALGIVLKLWEAGQ